MFSVPDSRSWQLVSVREMTLLFCQEDTVFRREPLISSGSVLDFSDRSLVWNSQKTAMSPLTSKTTLSYNLMNTLGKDLVTSVKLIVQYQRLPDLRAVRACLSRQMSFLDLDAAPPGIWVGPLSVAMDAGLDHTLTWMQDEPGSPSDLTIHTSPLQSTR